MVCLLSIRIVKYKEKQLAMSLIADPSRSYNDWSRSIR